MLRSLTGLRFFAALHVLLFHALAPLAAGGVYRFARPFVSTGYIAVSFFFVLSGFILVYAYREPLAAGSLDRRGFWVARIARIYPLYVVGLIASLPILRQHLSGDVAVDGALVSSILLGVQSLVPPFAGAWNPPAWSVSAELLFYASFVWVAPRVMRLSTRGAMGAMGIAYALSLSLSVLYMVVVPDGVYPVGPDHELFWLNLLKYSPVCRGFEFFMGLCLGRVFIAGDTRVRHPGAVAALLSGALLLAIGTGSWLPYPLVHNALYAPLFAALIFVLASSETTAVGRFLARPVWVKLGLSSYALYILHTPLLSLFSAGAKRLNLPAGLGYSLLVVALIVLLTVPAHRLIEEPARRWLRRRFAPAKSA